MEPTLLYGIVSIGAGVLILIVKTCFKSKCSDVSLCFGLIHVQRDIEQEIIEQQNENHSPSRELSLRNLNSTI
jgi:hypothetical protein